MLKNLLILFVFISCATKVTKPKKDDVTITPIEVIGTIDHLKVSSFVNHTEAELDRNTKALAKLSETFYSQCFYDYMTKRNLKETQGKTRANVVKHLRESSYTVVLEMYLDKKSNVKGYTYPSQDKIWLNRKYHDKYSPCEVAATLGHEFSHKLKYTHPYNSTPNRKYTVPYSIGFGVKKCCLN